MWYVYFLEHSNGDIYVGSTDDLRRRIVLNRQGEVKSTKAYLPVTLETYIDVQAEKHVRA